MYEKFGVIVPFVLRLNSDGIAPANSNKLLQLLLDQRKLWTLKIELSAYVESLKDLCSLCYFLEGDGTDMVFVVADKVNAFLAKYPDGSLKTLPSTERLIREAINWAVTDGGFEAPASPTDLNPPRATIAEIDRRVQNQVTSDRPRRRAAIEGVRNAVIAASAETDAARNRREAAMLREQEKEAAEAVRVAELEREAERLADAPPLTPDAWKAHIVSGIGPAIHSFTFTSRCADENGDRFKSMEVFQAARLFNPHFAKTVSHEEAKALLEKLRHYHVLNQEGEDNVVNALKRSFTAYRQNASLVVKRFDYDVDKAGILSW